MNKMDRLTFDQLFDSLDITQDPEELFWLVNRVEALHPKVILEIGISKGGTFKFWEQLLPKKGLLIGVDFDPDTENLICWNWKNSDRGIHIVIERSQSEKAVEKVFKILGEKKLDFIFIDGEHTNMGAGADFLNFYPHLSSGGMVAFHDVLEVVQLFFGMRGLKEVIHRTMGIGLWRNECL